MLARIVASVCALALVAGCGDVPTTVSYEPPPLAASRPALSAHTPELGPPLAFVLAVEAGELWTATLQWHAEEARQKEATKKPRDAPKRPRASSPTVPAPTRSGGSHRGYATAKECVMWVENGGDYGRSTNPTHFGRYQFSRPTWAAFGGNPSTWGSASAAEQDEVFERAWNSPGGPGNWLPYDGCG